MHVFPRSLALLAASTAVALAPTQLPASDDPAAEAGASDQGTSARPLERKLPKYPLGAAKRSLEGWVVVSYVVGRDGRVLDLVIEDSSGIPEFEEEVLEVVEQWTYEPAQLSGELVEQCLGRVLFPFALDPPRAGASSKFIRRYKKTINLLDEGRVEEASAQIDELWEQGTENLYESSRLWILRSMVYHHQGNVGSRLASLRKATIMGEPYLGPGTYREALRQMFALQLELGRYRDALDTFSRLETLAGDEAIEPGFVSAAEKVRALRAGEDPFRVKGEVGPPSASFGGAGFWQYSILRRMPGVEDIQGDVSRIEIRCDFQRFITEPSPGRGWRIPDDWGDCSIFVIGDPGSTFDLVEYGAKHAAP